VAVDFFYKMAAMKTMMVHVLDSSASMTGSITSPDTLPKISVAQAAIGSFLLQRMLASKTIEFGLLRFGGDDEGVSFVEEVVSISRPAMNVFELIQGVETSNTPGDVFEAIDSAHNVVMETNQGKKYNRVIVFYSDGESPISCDAETDQLTRQLIDDDCILFIILLIHNSDTDRLTSNINSFRKFASDAKGHMLVTNDLSGIMKFLSSGPGMGTRPTQNKITFELSPEFKIPCVYCGKTSKVSLPSLKKQSNVSYDPDIPDSGKVSLSTVYRNPADPDEELQFEDRVKGYRYGPQFIPFGGMDDNILKLASPPVIKLLGFLPASKVQRHQFLDACSVLGTNHSTPEGAGARKVLAALGKSMKTLGQVALARFVKRENSDPWLVVLMPPENSEDLGEYSDGSLILHRIPCAEDIRNFLFPPLSASTLTAAQRDSMSSAVSSMTFKGHLGPSGLFMFNPALLALLSAIQQKVANTDPHLMGISNFEGTFKSLGDTPASATAWKGVREHFPLIQCKNSDRSRKRKVYWADVEITNSNESALMDIKIETEKKVDSLFCFHLLSVDLTISCSPLCCLLFMKVQYSLLMNLH
jgi:hypothetical protein